MSGKPVTRVILAFLSLAGFFVALYLALYKFGVFGELKCRISGCETVNTSKWAMLFGLPVAAWGVAFYVAGFITAMISLSERYIASKKIALINMLMCGFGVLFSAWLTYLELYVIHAICMWCVSSAIIVTLMFITSVVDFKQAPKRV